MSSCWPHRQLVEVLHRARASVGRLSTFGVMSVRVTWLISHTSESMTRKLATCANVTQKLRQWLEVTSKVHPKGSRCASRTPRSTGPGTTHGRP